MNPAEHDLLVIDAHPDRVRVVTGLHWIRYGGLAAFSGPIETVRCFEDNSRVKETLTEAGHGRVLIHGACRDVEVLARLEFGVFALGCVPIKSVRRGEGQRGVPLSFGGVHFRSGDHLWADANGVVVVRGSLE